jgi:hypothetical protein
MWAAVGNLLRFYALLSFLGIGLAATNLSDLERYGVPIEPVLAIGLISIVINILLWMAKPALISGSPFFARWIIGLWLLLGIVTSFGLSLIPLAIAYLLTGEPETETFFRQDQPVKPRFTPPRDWQPSGRVGASGATVYEDADRGEPVAMLESFLPVQVMDRRRGYTRVVAASGAAGWIDDRTLSEGV